MNRPDPTSSLRAAAAAAMLLFAGLAQAETGPWYVGASQGFTHDSNVFRVPDAQSDTISTTGVFGGLDLPISRQRLRADLAANWNRYSDHKELNHTDGRAGLRLDWETVHHLSGDLQLSHRRSLFTDYQQQSLAQQKTIATNTNAQFNARLGVVTAWTVEAGVFGDRSRYEGSSLSSSDVDYDGYRAAVRYNPSSLLSLGLGGRHSNGEYPNAPAIGEFDRDDIDLLADWRPTGTSTLSARVSRSKLDYANVSGRSQKITTGSLRYLWQPGGRLALNATLRRDNNAGAYHFDTLTLVGQQFTPDVGTFADTRVSTITGVGGTYELTGKIKLAFDYLHTERDLDNRLSAQLLDPAPPPTSASDRTNRASLNATWDATRWLRVGCGYTHVKRSVSDNPAGLTYPYAVNLATCSAQVALQP